MSGSTNFLGSSGFGTKPAYGGFFSAPEQFGSNKFVSPTPIDASSHPLFGLEALISEIGDTRFGKSDILGQLGQEGNISVVSYPTIIEEDGGTSRQTAKLESISAMPAYTYERFESCVAIAGADYCLMAADYTRDHTKISQLFANSYYSLHNPIRGKCVMASYGFQANLKVLQEDLSAGNLHLVLEITNGGLLPEGESPTPSKDITTIVSVEKNLNGLL